MTEAEAAREYCEVLDAFPEPATAMIGLSEDGSVLTVGRQAERLFGDAAAQAVGRSPQTLVRAPWPSWAQVSATAGEAGHMRFEGVGLRSNGNPFPVLVSIVPREDGGGRRWMAALVRDLTESQGAARLAGRLAAITRLSFEAIIETTGEGLITDWNPGAERLYGYRAEEIVGRPIHALSPQGKWPAGHGLLEQATNGNAEHYRTECQHKDGRRLLVAGVVAPLLDAAENIVGVTFISRQADTFARFQLDVLEALPDAVFAVDATGAISMVNSEAERMFGYTRRQLLGRTVETLVPETARHMHAIARTGYPARGHDRPFGTELNLRARRSDGTVFPADVALKRIEMQEGMVTVAVVRDQTEQRQMQAERTRLQAQAEQARLSAATLRADQMRNLGELAGGIAHEFNNLLAVMSASTEFLAEFLADHHASEQVAADLDRLRSAEERAARLTRQLLIVSRRDIAVPQAVDLNVLVDDAVALLRRTLGERIDIRVSLTDELPPVMADIAQLEQVVINLALNARDAMPQGGVLTITTDLAESISHLGADTPVEVPRRHVRLVVSDTGTGMPPEIAERVFEAFFTTKQATQGTGLGLSTVHGIVTQAGGRITLDSRPEAGTTFTVVLPAAQAASSAESTVADRPAGPAGPGPDPGRDETILVVEDEPNLLEVIERTLARRGFSVLTAPDGERALQVAQEHDGRIHMLLTDVVMPGITGPEAAARIRAVRPGIPVLLMSGYARPGILPPALSPDIPLLKKPFTPAGLLNAVQQVLDVHTAHDSVL